MNGSIQPKNGKLYAVLSYRGENGKFKYKWVNTGLPVRGNKKKAEAMIPVFIERFAYLEENKEENLAVMLRQKLQKKGKEAGGDDKK